MIIKGTLIANDIDIKVAISVEITVTGVFFYQFEISDWHINCQSNEICFLLLRNGYNYDYNQQPSNASSTLISYPRQ